VKPWDILTLEELIKRRDELREWLEFAQRIGGPSAVAKPPASNEAIEGVRQILREIEDEIATRPAPPSRP
jgi:hypothetical protein